MKLNLLTSIIFDLTDGLYDFPSDNNLLGNTKTIKLVER